MSVPNFPVFLYPPFSDSQLDIDQLLSDISGPADDEEIGVYLYYN